MEGKIFELYMDQEARNTAHNMTITKDMLTGQGAFAATNYQFTFELQAYKQLK